MKWIGTYAGYSQQLLDLFCKEVANNYNPIKLKLIEPMCGSGNLLVQFEKNQLPYTAYDINPVQVVQCNAKIANISNMNHSKIRSDLRKLKVKEIRKTIISREWFSPDVSSCLIDLHNNILGYAKNKAPDVGYILQGAFILALRRNACIAISSNPTWLKEGGIIPGTEIKQTFLSAYDFIVRWHEDTYLEKRTAKYGHVSHKNVNDMNKPNYYDICIVSPPYCNRLDYKRMFAPEYYFLRTFVQTGNNDYFMGNNEVRYFDISTYTPTKYEYNLLKKIRMKQAPENKDYYFRYYTKYLSELDSLLRILINSLKVNGELYINVQNSHYKDVEVNLDNIIQSKIEEKHIVSELYSKHNSFFGNLLKANKRQKETVLKIVKNDN